MALENPSTQSTLPMLGTAQALSNEILPIFLGVLDSAGGPPKPIEHLGTGFLIAPRIFVTCAHCVPLGLDENQVLITMFLDPTGRWVVLALTDVSHDPDGNDLATARIECDPTFRLVLSAVSLPAGEPVWSFGFPLLDVERLPTGDLAFTISPRYLRGHVTRPFYYRRYGPEREVMSYELNMPTPEGLSGAPVMLHDSKAVVGVVYGHNDVALVEQYATVDEETGARQSEVQRIVSFGLAHHTETLHDLRGLATGGRPLKELVELR